MAQDSIVKKGGSVEMEHVAVVLEEHLKAARCDRELLKTSPHQLYAHRGGKIAALVELKIALGLQEPDSGPVSITVPTQTPPVS